MNTETKSTISTANVEEFLEKYAVARDLGAKVADLLVDNNFTVKRFETIEESPYFTKTRVFVESDHPTIPIALTANPAFNEYKLALMLVEDEGKQPVYTHGVNIFNSLAYLQRLRRDNSVPSKITFASCNPLTAGLEIVVEGKK